MVQILVAAENFAFGPAGKLLTIAPRLKALGHRLEFVGFGTALDLVSHDSSFDAIHELATENERFSGSLQVLVERADLVVSCMDQGVMKAARIAGVPAVWIDSLFYWWESLPPDVLEADLYIKQDVLPDHENLAKYSGLIPNLLAVGPIVDPFGDRSARSPKNRAIVCFGGMEAPGWYETGKNHNYPFTVIKMLSEQVNFDSFDEVLVTGSSKVISKLRGLRTPDKFRFATLSHADFVAALGESRIALLSGGLETTLEAFDAGVPAIFLPPLNVTHHLQVAALRAAGVARASVHFSDYFEAFDWTQASRRQKVTEFLARLGEFERSREMLSDASARIASWLQDGSLHREIRVGQADFMNNLKPGGLENVVSAIEALTVGIEQRARSPHVSIRADTGLA